MEYIRPHNMKEALQVKKRWGNRSKVIAGGTNVLPDIRAKALQAQALVDLSNLKNLSYIKEEKKKIRIGALTTISELASSKIIQKFAPILSEASDHLGNPLVRNRATIGGNLADASPAADTAVPLLVLEATVLVERDGGKSRQIPIDQFFLGPNQTALKREEIIREIHFQKPDSNTRMAYAKLGLRNAMAISVVSVAILMEGRRNQWKRVRIALGAVAPRPIRAYRVEEMLDEKEMTEQLINACCEKVEKEINPITDIRASAEYRRAMTSVLLKRLIKQVRSREPG